MKSQKRRLQARCSACRGFIPHGVTNLRQTALAEASRRSVDPGPGQDHVHQVRYRQDQTKIHRLPLSIETSELLLHPPSDGVETCEEQKRQTRQGCHKRTGAALKAAPCPRPGTTTALSLATGSMPARCNGADVDGEPVSVVPTSMVAAFMAADRDDVWDIQADVIDWVWAHSACDSDLVLVALGGRSVL